MFRLIIIVLLVTSVTNVAASNLDVANTLVDGIGNELLNGNEDSTIRFIPSIDDSLKLKSMVRNGILLDTSYGNDVSLDDNNLDSAFSLKPKRGFFHKVGDVFTHFFREFNTLDERYVEAQKYNYTAMLQNTNNYEVYTLTTSSSGHSYSFAPEMSYKLGPYFGWRWVFLGYTIDLTHISSGENDKNRTEFDLSLYSSMLGVDLYWRETGNSFRVQSVDLGDGIDTSPLEGESFSGIRSTIKGINAYYIFNHKKFSYPAAYAQSNVQRKSAGSILAGMGYTVQTLSLDWKDLAGLIEDKLQSEQNVTLDSSLLFGTIHYSDISFSLGYAYNWVFAKNWLLDISLQASLAYKQSSSEQTHDGFSLHDFSFNNFNFDGVGRFALVYNNSRWFAGISSILHTYNYRKSRFSTNNMFGSLNFYIGFNFGRKK